MAKIVEAMGFYPRGGPAKSGAPPTNNGMAHWCPHRRRPCALPCAAVAQYHFRADPPLFGGHSPALSVATHTLGQLEWQALRHVVLRPAGAHPFPL